MLVTEIGRKTEFAAYPSGSQEGGLEEAVRTGLYRSGTGKGMNRIETFFLISNDIDGTRRGILPGTLVNIILLTDGQIQPRDILQGKTGEVYLSGLAVAYFDAVIAYAGMLGTESPDIYGLQPSYSSVVLDLDPCKML